MCRVSATPSRGSVADRVTAAAATSFVGRAEQRSRLAALLAPDGPAVVFVHGPGGIGKTALVTGTLASLPLKPVFLDGRQIEPTAPGALAAVGSALDVPAPPSTVAAARAISDAAVDVLVVDSFERLNLLDGWMRNELICELPASVMVVLVGRRGPNVAWRTAPGWRNLLAELVVGPMTANDVDLLLSSYRLEAGDAERIRGFARGHPLAVVLAAEAFARRPGLLLDSGGPADAVEELFSVILDDLPPEDRATVESVSVLRRVTRPLLAAVVEGQDVDEAWRTLQRLPFTATTTAGLELSGVAAPVVLEALELRDPLQVRALRARAARAIVESLSVGLDWQSTADLLHLVQNPLIRNAYAPMGMLQHPVEAARDEDRTAIVAIAERFTGEDDAKLVEQWWSTRRDTFNVVRGATGDVAGFSATAILGSPPELPSDDPVVQAVTGNLQASPMPLDATAVVFRWALGNRHGERPSPEVAALVVDLKRTYLELRATLRRVYTVIADWPAAAPVLQVMGFNSLQPVEIGARQFVLACLDFGPGGVNAWIGRHVLTEQTAPASASAGRDTSQPQEPALLTLTAREQEVLALLAEGLTNAQLAQALFISERTANRHVSNIFLKLGVHNRTQAARAWSAAGLSG
jgi:DNA-binding CsgD family transcriptional regulator